MAKVKIAKLKIGDQLRRSDGVLCHVRGFVDERIVLRWWRGAKARWEYAVEGSEAFTVGIYTREASS